MSEVGKDGILKPVNNDTNNNVCNTDNSRNNAVVGSEETDKANEKTE